MVIDFHSHILPGIDDGSSSVEESIEMLRLSAQQGITHMVATPHFYAHNDTPDRFLRRRHEAEKRLREAMEGIEGLPQLTMGAEVRYFRGISQSDSIFRLTIAGKSCILIEMPEVLWTDYMYQELEDIWNKRKLVPIIAHVDRYISPLRTRGIPERLSELPVLVQANASFFLKNATARFACRLLRQERIQLLGSDCHNLDTRRPNLGPAVQTIEKRLGSESLAWIKSQEALVFAEER